LKINATLMTHNAGCTLIVERGYELGDLDRQMCDVNSRRRSFVWRTVTTFDLDELM